MVNVQGNATAGHVYNEPTPDLPRPKPGRRPAHKPWCRDCKRRVDSGADLDTTGRCSTCGPLVAVRAAAAERRRLADAADAKVVGRPDGNAGAPKAPRKAGGRRRVLDGHSVDVVRRYQDGEGARLISETYGCTEATVLNFLRAAGVPIRGRGGRPIPTEGAA